MTDGRAAAIECRGDARQGAGPARGRAAASPASAQLPLARRAWMATRLYHAVLATFAHWRGVPALDFDAAFRRYLDRVLATDDRFEFDLASMELLAGLRNGHTGFGDRWMRERCGQSIGFAARPIDGRWVVTSSSVRGLRVGAVVARIDQQPFEEFFAARRRYISASDDRWARRALFEYPYLFPRSFTLELDDGRKLSITRRGAFRWPGSDAPATSSRTDGDALWVRVPSFAEPRFEDAAIAAIRKSRARVLVIDLRGNHGGSTPAKLTEALMDRRYRWWAESTPVGLPLFRHRGAVSERSDISWQSEWEKPPPAGDRRPLYLLVDGGCYSACEDFVVPFKDNRRATIVGERTGGSSGQPISVDLGDGMGAGIGAKRELFPDGREFEGIGITPDHEIAITARDIQSGRDPAADAVRKLIAGAR